MCDDATMEDEEPLETTEVMAELGLKTASAVSRMVARGEITPAKKHRGTRGPFLFARAEVERVKKLRAS